MKDRDFVIAHSTAKQCLDYSMAYATTLVDRAWAEDNEFFAVKGMSRDEMIHTMAHNVCKPQLQMRARQFRDTTAKINEKNYLQDEIRRLYNGGHKFHPYL